MVSRDTMRRVVVWISGRGRAANGMVYGSREDGGDPCSVRVTRSHAMLATRALCRLRARVIAILAKTHIVESWASKGSCPQIACFSTKQERSTEPGGQFLTTIFGGLLPICYILKNETWRADVLVAVRSVRAFFMTNLRHSVPMFVLCESACESGKCAGSRVQSNDGS